MTVTERLMGVGQWELDLAPDTPRWVMEQLSIAQPGVGFSNIVITNNVVDVQDYDDAGMLAISRYTGVYRSQPSEFAMRGLGGAFYIGDEDGKGPSIALGPVTTSGGTFGEWVSALKPAQLPLGSFTEIAGGFAATYERTGLRAPLDEVCAFFQAEWRVTPELKFDAGPRGALFSQNPKAVIVRNAGDAGQDSLLRGIVGELNLARDLEDYQRRVVYYTKNGDETIAANQALGGISDTNAPFRGPFGAAISMDRLVEDFNAPVGSGPQLAVAEFEKYANGHEELTVTSKDYDIGANVRVGDNVFIYDMNRGLYDPGNPRDYGGTVIYPRVIRCVGYTWPIRKGMGAYLRYWVPSGGAVWTPKYLDITEYVVPETSDTKVEVGAKPR